MYTVTQAAFRTPRGQSVTLSHRADTNDWNILNSCLTEDEYRLRELNLSGNALDIGAHIGGVTVALAVDNPDLHITAIEAVPPNIELLRENVERAGVGERVTIIHAAAGKGKTTTVKWAFEGHGDVGSHNAFVGNALLPVPIEAHASTVLDVVTLASLVRDLGPIAFIKTDCEGCEYPFLAGKALEQVALIRGEFHANPADLASQLIATHDVSHDKQTPGAFEAVRRG